MSFFPDPGTEPLELPPMTPWIRLTLPLSAILLQACVSTPDEVATTSDVGASTGSTSGGPGPSTTPGTTMPGEDTMGTQGGTGMETTMGAVDTTAGTSTSAEDTTAGIDPTTSSSGGESSSTGEPPPPECLDDAGCPNNEICDTGACVDACGGAWAVGGYGACINAYAGTDVDGLCSGGPSICIVDDNPVGASTCSLQSCVDVCDCPAPPGTGDATVTCANITSGGTPNDCYLDCGDGETCPDGMSCFAGYVCMTTIPVEVPTYGNCEGVTSTCALPAFCFSTGTTSVCEQDCVVAGDCPAAPPTGNAPVACGYINMNNPGPECYLDCSGGQTCPAGMGCYNNTLCAFL